MEKERNLRNSSQRCTLKGNYIFKKSHSIFVASSFGLRTLSKNLNSGNLISFREQNSCHEIEDWKRFKLKSDSGGGNLSAKLPVELALSACDKT